MSDTLFCEDLVIKQSSSFADRRRAVNGERIHTRYYKLPQGGLLRNSAVRIIEPRSEKTSLRGFRPGPTQTGLYNHRRWLEA